MEEREKKELELKLRRLEEDYGLVKSGLMVGLITTILAIIAVIVNLAAPTEKMQTLSGDSIVAIVGIVAAAIVICFYFVNRRLAAIKLEISKTKIAMEIVSSGKAK